MPTYISFIIKMIEGFIYTALYPIDRSGFSLLARIASSSVLGVLYRGLDFFFPGNRLLTLSPVFAPNVKIPTLSHTPRQGWGTLSRYFMQPPAFAGLDSRGRLSSHNHLHQSLIQ